MTPDLLDKPKANCFKNFKRSRGQMDFTEAESRFTLAFGTSQRSNHGSFSIGSDRRSIARIEFKFSDNSIL